MQSSRWLGLSLATVFFFLCGCGNNANGTHWTHVQRGNRDLHQGSGSYSGQPNQQWRSGNRI